MIDVFTFLTNGSEGYARDLSAALRNRAEHPGRIRLHLMRDATFNGSLHSIHGYLHPAFPLPYPPGTGRNGANHASLLNRVPDYIPDDSEVVIIADVDTMVLTDAWDTVLMRHLSYGVPVITPKFSGPPGPYFSAFEARSFRSLRPDWRPGCEANEWKCDSDMVDTGYRIAKYFPYAKYMDLDPDYSMHYLYRLEGLPFVSHMGASHKHPYGGQRCNDWRKLCDSIHAASSSEH